MQIDIALANKVLIYLKLWNVKCSTALFLQCFDLQIMFIFGC